MKKSKPMSRVITEEEFSRKLQKRAQRIFSIGNVLLKKKDLEQIYYSNLQAEAHALETFLDNHKARGNKKFSYFTELVACIRWIANAIYTIKHIQNRFKNYNLEENEKLFQDMDNFITFCNKVLSDLYIALQKEAITLGIKIQPKYIEEEDFLETEVQEYLVQDIDESYCGFYEEEKIIEVTFNYVDVADKLVELLKTNSLTEDKVAELTGSFQRIQTKYDSYITGSEEEKKDKRLKRLRGHISICLHLLEAVLFLLHFYERHIKGESLGEAKKRISKIVDSSKLFENVKRILVHAKEYALSGDTLARALLKDYADMTLAREKVIIPQGSILHLRPASALVEPVVGCTTPVLLEIDGKRVRANSVLEIIAVMGEVADKIEKNDVEMILQGDQEVVRKMKENFLSKILETRH